MCAHAHVHVQLLVGGLSCLVIGQSISGLSVSTPVVVGGGGGVVLAMKPVTQPLTLGPLGDV